MYSVLLADDSEDDRLLFKLAASRVSGLKLMGSVTDGWEAICYLEGKGEYRDRHLFPLPDLLFLDLKMPRVSGLEVLRWLQTRRSKPRVIVLSGSDLIADVEQALALGADDFKVKPNESGELVELLKGVLEAADRAMRAPAIPDSAGARHGRGEAVRASAGI
jgi:CheY-like chemotaxis protein